MRKISESLGMPGRSSITVWLAEDPSFSAQYAQAWAASADIDVEEMYQIADDSAHDFEEREREDGSRYMVLNRDHVQRSKLRTDVRMWAASRKAPKKYGKHLDLSIGGNGKPIAQITAEMTPEEAALAYQAALRGE